MENILKPRLQEFKLSTPRLREVFYVVLVPLSMAWGAVSSLRRRHFPKKKTYRSRLPVISIGNIHSGGSGKTPVTCALAKHFSERNPVVVSRGYRASLSDKGAKVDRQGSHAVGDEPWMLHRLFGLNVWIGKDRTKNIRAIESGENSRLILLEDGFQHFRVQRDVDLVLIDTNQSIDEAHCIPLGNLREPISALENADALLLTGSDPEKFALWKDWAQREFSKIPIFEAKLKIEGLFYGDKPASELREKSLLGFSGIAGNSRFERSLSYCPKAVYLKGFQDHFNYQDEDVREIIREGKERGVDAFVTTDKDWVKVERLFRELDEVVLSLRIAYEFENSFWDYVEGKIKRP